MYACIKMECNSVNKCIKLGVEFVGMYIFSKLRSVPDNCLDFRKCLEYVVCYQSTGQWEHEGDRGNRIIFLGKSADGRSIGMQVNYKLIGIRIREIRKRKKMTQECLAEATGLSDAYISKVECGAKASLESLLRIAEVLDVTLNDIVVGNQKKTISDMNNEFSQLIADCNHYERRIIYEMADAMKQSLLRHRNFIRQTYINDYPD